MKFSEEKDESSIKSRLNKQQALEATKNFGRYFLELTGVDHSDPHTYFRKIDTRFMLVYFFFYLPKWLMTSLWLLSRIRFGVVEMGFEPKNVTKITSYHITST